MTTDDSVGERGSIWGRGLLVVIALLYLAAIWWMQDKPWLWR